MLANPLTAKWVSKGRKARCDPNEDYPYGKALDITDGARGCTIKLDYPSPCCGVWVIECAICGTRVAVTAAGRADDPTNVTIPCKLGANR